MRTLDYASYSAPPSPLRRAQLSLVISICIPLIGLALLELCDVMNSWTVGDAGFVWLIVGGISVFILMGHTISQLATLDHIAPDHLRARRLYWWTLLACVLSFGVAYYCATAGSRIISDIGDGLR